MMLKTFCQTRRVFYVYKVKTLYWGFMGTDQFISVSTDLRLNSSVSFLHSPEEKHYVCVCLSDTDARRTLESGYFHFATIGNTW